METRVRERSFGNIFLGPIVSVNRGWRSGCIQSQGNQHRGEIGEKSVSESEGDARLVAAARRGRIRHNELHQDNQCRGWHSTASGRRRRGGPAEGSSYRAG